jgi:hypothetical protein
MLCDHVPVSPSSAAAHIRSADARHTNTETSGLARQGRRLMPRSRIGGAALSCDGAAACNRPACYQHI